MNTQRSFSKNTLQEKKNNSHARLENMPINNMFLLEDVFPHAVRHRVLWLLDGLLGLSFFVALMLALVLYTPVGSSFAPLLSYELLLSGILRFALAGVFITFGFWLMVYVSEAFYRSLYYHNREYKTKHESVKSPMVSEVAQYFHEAKDDDILRAFLTSSVGRQTLERLAIFEGLEEFLNTREDLRTTSFYELQQKEIRTREDLAGYLYEKHEEFADFLFERQVTEDIFLGALAWVVQNDIRRKFRERWWSKSHLLKFPVLGKEWAYGGAYELGKYSHDLSSSLGGEDTADYRLRRKKYVEDVEAILSKQTEANALLVGDDGGGKKEVLRDMARRVATGEVPDALIGHRLVSLHTDLLVSGFDTKNEFERAFLKVLNDAGSAGNVVLVFEDFPAFIKSASQVGSDVLRLLDKFLENPEMKIIALSNEEKYHQQLETNSLIASRFGVVKMKEPGLHNVVSILEDRVPSLEREYGLFFTYPSLLQIVNTAKYYITEGVMPDKALDLMIEVAPFAAQSGVKLIDQDYVENYVGEKTSIPMGSINQEEQEKLEHLEDRLHKLVVGQEHAIDTLSDTLRRSRTGIRDMEKPIGSFLFLGPTGVGKTQTAKAIAQIFFDDRKALSRIDMSEYQGANALERLIGSFDSGQVGTLTTTVKSNPYGVLLLDEFEKSDKRVHDLFLQVFDEGFFSDMNGRKVNARNLIFIATSNAGSDMIWQASERGEDMTQMKDKLTNYMIENSIYRPEFLNRFDDVVVFHPLSETHLREIAEIMLAGTQKRIKEKGYRLVVNELLINYVMKIGYDPTFGARPMERAIKDTVENIISKKIIHGSLKKGKNIELSEEDFQEK